MSSAMMQTLDAYLFQPAVRVHFFMRDIESKFDERKVIGWMQKYWTLSILFSALYLLFVYFGRKWMENRKPFQLRRTLCMWSALLSFFSAFCLLRGINLIATIINTGGWLHSACDLKYYTGTHAMGLFPYLFVFSKLPELFDTMFIVLRKTPLSFLHYYHHVTVFIYCWYCYAYPISPGMWFGFFNFFVHAIMYAYYAIKASGRNPPRIVAKCITILQLSQMFMGMFVNLIAIYYWLNGVTCGIRWSDVAISLFIYVSYAILFANFFYFAYIHKKPKKEQNTNEQVSHTEKVTPKESRLNGLSLNGTSPVGNGNLRYRSP